jgi:cytochrome c oxidase cbb3-type subunit 1
MHPFYVIRALGGVLFIAGYLLMVYNIFMTIRSGEEAAASAQPSLQPAE